MTRGTHDLRVPADGRDPAEGGDVEVVSDAPGSQRSPLRERIAADRDRTRARIAALARQRDDIIAAARDANTDDEHDPEGATIAFERAQVTDLLRSARAHLEELDAAAARLDAGTSGACERCQRPIPDERLLARPTARRYVTCATTTDA